MPDWWGDWWMAKHVLLIEDEPNIIEAISFILRQDGWKVSTHSDGTKAVAEIARVAPDLVILDVMLPGRSGFEILQDLRSRAETEKLPVLMLTAKGQTRDRQAAQDLGASHYMTKPFSNQEMLDVVRGLIA
jgi:DNA-binding response OmpR family regulator